MGAPIGNTNGRNARIFRDSLNKVLTTYESEDGTVKRGQALDKINTELVEQAIAGKEWATQMVANRTDGKPVQVQEIAVEINARWVIESYMARLGEAGTRTLLESAGAANLLPVLEQLRLERPEAIEHEAQS